MPEGMSDANVQQSVPFFRVSSMERSLRFYVDGLGFEMTHKWVPDGTVRWCWLQRGGAALMLQDFRRDDGTQWIEIGFESLTDVPEETVFEDDMTNASSGAS